MPKRKKRGQQQSNSKPSSDIKAREAKKLRQAEAELLRLEALAESERPKDAWDEIKRVASDIWGAIQSVSSDLGLNLAEGFKLLL